MLHLHTLPLEVVSIIESFLVHPSTTKSTAADCIAQITRGLDDAAYFGRYEVLRAEKHIAASRWLADSNDSLFFSDRVEKQMRIDPDSAPASTWSWNASLRRVANRSRGPRSRRFRYYLNFQRIERHCTEGCGLKGKHYRYCTGDIAHVSLRRAFFCGDDLGVAALLFSLLISDLMHRQKKL